MCTAGPRGDNCRVRSWNADSGGAECGVRSSVAQPPLVPAIVGPTGVGKTAVAAAWAALEPISVVSADPRQAYRGLDIGPAKPPLEAQPGGPHVGLDLRQPSVGYCPRPCALR